MLISLRVYSYFLITYIYFQKWLNLILSLIFTSRDGMDPTFSDPDRIRIQKFFGSGSGHGIHDTMLKTK